MLSAEGGIPQDVAEAFVLLGQLEETVNGAFQAMKGRADASKIQDKDQASLVVDEVLKQIGRKQLASQDLSPASSCESKLSKFN